MDDWRYYQDSGYPDDEFDDESIALLNQMDVEVPDDDSDDERDSTADFESDNAKEEIPTSSSNASRPRTLAAAYTPNPQRPTEGTLTVIFRDGATYKYFNVSPGEWENFHGSVSKGRPWLNNGGTIAAKPYVRIWDYEFSPEVQSLIANAKLIQERATTKYRYKTGQVVTRAYTSKKTGKKHVYQYDVRAPRVSQDKLRKLGRNPSTGGKPPKR